MTLILTLPLTNEYADRVEWGDLKRLLSAVGEFPDGVADITRLVIDQDGATITVRPFRRAEAIADKAPLPDVSPVELQLSWDEINSNPEAAGLVAQVRAAIWNLVLNSPKLLRGSPPPEGQPDQRKHVFDGGVLAEI